MKHLYQPSEDAIAEFKELWEKTTLPPNTRLGFIGTDKLKYPIKIQKANDTLMFFTQGLEIIVHLNENMLDALDEKAREIVVMQEINKVEYHSESKSENAYKVKSNGPAFDAGILSKYGQDDIVRTMQLIRTLANPDDTLENNIESLQQSGNPIFFNDNNNE